ncbi:MAG TPA: selenocysteine-specific translation elongation factor [Terriglobales bacterium]|nr:selenocysteine-specific translation elongation factor [Terriglobales bacterium]
MKSVIIGTAGHIDHGKTALVKALTGIDADRLEEEKRRGITIDIGFAHLNLKSPNGEDLRLGFVDVPGHERFVRNMLAGIGGIDLVLLVIAADEGIKPQTVEHFDICRLLRIRRGITVITKADAVDAETLDVVRLELEEFLRGSFLAHAPMVAVSSLKGSGLDDLKRELSKAAAEVPAKDSSALFRLPIDRVFTMKGFGTVVTGTLIAGTVKKDEELEVFPSGRRVRVRGVQVHGKAAEHAVAGQRTAINLAGVELEDLERGMTLAPPGLLHTTKRLDVSLAVLPSARVLKDRARVHLHAYASETIAEVVLYREKELKPGESGYAQLRLTEPLLLLPGDRFILRQFSPVVTVGGGVVIDAAPLARRARQSHDSDAHVAQPPLAAQNLPLLAEGTREQVLFARIARRGSNGLRLIDALAETGWPPEVVASTATALVSPKAPPELRALRLNEFLIAQSAVTQSSEALLNALKKFHDSNPLVGGMGKEQLREHLHLAPEIFAGLIDLLAKEKKMEVGGELVRLPGRGVVMKDEEAEAKKKIEDAFSSAGLEVPYLKDVIPKLPVDKARAQKIVTLLLRDRVLVKVSDDLVFHRSALEALRKRLLAFKAKSASIDVAGFKDLTGVTRKYAIPLLEYFDRERVTRRVGDKREIL